jgi:hypothetical protein
LNISRISSTFIRLQMKKVLLDENLPIKLKYRLQEFCNIYTVSDKGWNSLENGDLIKAMLEDEFDYLLTSDKNLQYQQNLSKYPIGFIILDVLNNNYETILPLIEKVKNILTEKDNVKFIVIQ